MLHQCRRPGRILAFCLFLLLFQGHFALTGAAGPERVIPNPREQQRIQQIVNEFMATLNMAQKVAVAVVPKNPLMVSVEPGDSTQFLLSVEEDFIGDLTQDELEAAIAHEVGHVWIFTHHPFLQTEVLANHIAQRLVPRSSLVRVYEKLWKRQGTEGDLIRFVGD